MRLVQKIDCEFFQIFLEALGYVFIFGFVKAFTDIIDDAKIEIPSLIQLFFQQKGSELGLDGLFLFDFFR